MNYWLDVFTDKSWREFLDAGSAISGFSKRMANTVGKINIGDILLCYMKKHCCWFAALKVTSKAFYDDKNLIWSDDIYPCRIKVRPIIILARDNRIPLGDTLSELKLFKPVQSKDIRAKGLVLRPAPKRLSKEDGEYLIRQLEVRFSSTYALEKQADNKTSIRYHDKIKGLLAEIGELEGLMPNTEYERFDVIWRKRREGSVPSHVFEVHISGEIYKELTKLKNANTNWNSKVFYVTPENQVGAVQKCITESFTEIQNKVKIIACEHVEQWHHIAKRNKEIVDTFGLYD